MKPPLERPEVRKCIEQLRALDPPRPQTPKKPYSVLGSRVPANWRDQLPPTPEYYAPRLEGLTAPRGRQLHWRARCPFHNDADTCLRVDLRSRHGNWHCTQGCGHGDMLRFHARLYRVPIRLAAAQLAALGRAGAGRCQHEAGHPSGSTGSA